MAKYPPWKKHFRTWKKKAIPKGNNRLYSIPIHPFSGANWLLVSGRVKQSNLSCFGHSSGSLPLRTWLLVHSFCSSEVILDVIFVPWKSVFSFHPPGMNGCMNSSAGDIIIYQYVMSFHRNTVLRDLTLSVMLHVLNSFMNWLLHQPQKSALVGCTAKNQVLKDPK